MLAPLFELPVRVVGISRGPAHDAPLSYATWLASTWHDYLSTGGKSDAGDGGDDWGAFAGDDAVPAAAPAPAPANQHANGFASAGPAAPFGSVGGWSGFGTGPAPPPPANGWGGGAAPTAAAVLSTEETAHRRGVSAGGALPEDLFSEPAQPAPTTAADGPVGEAEDDDFGDFADAEPVLPVPAQQPAGKPGLGSLSTDWQATGPQAGHPLPGNASVEPQQPPNPAQPALPLAGLSALPAVQFSASAEHSPAAPGSAHPVPTGQPSQPAPVADDADNGFADFGAFAEAESAAGGDSSTAVSPSDALWHSLPPVHPSTAPGSAAAPFTASSEAQSAAVSPPTPVVPLVSTEPAAAAAAGGFFGSAPQTGGADSALHRRGVSRCAFSMPVRTAS